MKNQRLFRVLLNMMERPQYEVARELDVSTASLSRHADGLLRRRSVLKRASELFSSFMPDRVIVDESLLMLEIRPEDLVRLALTLRIENLKKTKRC